MSLEIESFESGALGLEASTLWTESSEIENSEVGNFIVLKTLEALSFPRSLSLKQECLSALNALKALMFSKSYDVSKEL